MRLRSIACFLLVCAAAPVPAAIAAPRHNFFISDGVKLHYLTDGEGEPVVLIHGFAANAFANWVLPGTFEALSKHYRVIALDNRGHGGSDKPHDPAKYGTEMVEDVVRLLDHLKIKQAHIVGYSMGAFITNKLVTTHPERVLSATLGGAGWGRETDDHSVIDAVAKSLDEGKGIVPLIRALSPPGQGPPSDEDVQVKNRVLMLANDPKALSACMRGVLTLAVPRERLERNTVPVLAIIGEDDPLKRGVDAMQGVMSHLKVIVIKGGTHMSTFRMPRFQEALLAFLAAHSERPAGPAPM